MEENSANNLMPKKEENGWCCLVQMDESRKVPTPTSCRLLMEEQKKMNKTQSVKMCVCVPKWQHCFLLLFVCCCCHSLSHCAVWQKWNKNPASCCRCHFVFCVLNGVLPCWHAFTIQQGGGNLRKCCDDIL